MQALKKALTNIRRQPYQSLMAMLMMSLVFFASFVLTMIIFGATQIIGYFESRPQVIAFFSTDSEKSKLENGAQFMKDKSYVEKVKIVTKEDALSLYKEDNKNDPILLELVTADIFPASLEVSAKEITSLPQIRDDLQSLDGVEDVMYQKDIIESLTSIIRNVRIVGLVIIAFLLLMSLMFIGVILSLRISLKRHEIGVMKLLGAGVSYIVAPYMMEGMIYGALGAIVGWLGMFTLYLYLTPTLIQFFGSIIHFPVSVTMFGVLLCAGIGSGMLIGVIGSFAAVRRFVRKNKN